MDKLSQAMRRACPAKAQTYIEKLEKRLANKSQSLKAECDKVLQFKVEVDQTKARFVQICETAAARINLVEAANEALKHEIDLCNDPTILGAIAQHYRRMTGSSARERVVSE